MYFFTTKGVSSFTALFMSAVGSQMSIVEGNIQAELVLLVVR